MVGAAFAIGADLYWRQPPADFESRLAALEARPRPTASPAPTATAPSSDALAGLDRRIGAIEAQARTLAEGLAAARSTAEARGGTTPPAAAAASPDPGLRDALGALDGRVAKLEGASGAGASQDSVAALGSRLQQADERARANATALATLQSQAGSTAERLAAESARIAALQADLGKLPPALLGTALRVIVAGQAGESLRDGAPLGPAIAAFGRLGVAGEAVAPLQPFATEPAPSPAALLAAFRPLGDRLTAAPTSPSDSFADRLKRIAEKVVTIRAVGDGSGEDVPGLVGRIEAALGRGALADAAAAWEKLPAAARTETAAWGARLKARVAAGDALRRLGAESLAALSAPAR